MIVSGDLCRIGACESVLRSDDVDVCGGGGDASHCDAAGEGDGPACGVGVDEVKETGNVEARR